MKFFARFKKNKSCATGCKNEQQTNETALDQTQVVDQNQSESISVDQNQDQLQPDQTSNNE